MKTKYRGNPEAFPAKVKECGVPGYWRSRNGGAHRQFKAVTGEYLNYWPSNGTVMIQGRSDGPLARRFAQLTASPTRGTPSMGRTVEVAPGIVRNSEARSPHDPMDFGRRHSIRGADLAAMNERQARLRSIVAGLPCEDAVAELVLSSVRHAVDYLPEDEVAEALNAVAAKISEASYKWIDLYASIAVAFEIDADEDS